MQSWMMKLWLNCRDKSKRPELPIYQPEDACHVTRAEEHPSKEVIEAMCSEGFFTHHKYQYVQDIPGSENDKVYDEPGDCYECIDCLQSPQEPSPLDRTPQLPQEDSSTTSIPPEHNFKSVEVDVSDPTRNSEKQLSESKNDSYRPTSIQERASKDSNYCGDDDEEEEPFSSDNANGKTEDDASRDEIDNSGLKADMYLGDKTGYRELDKSSKGYMPLAKEPCYIKSENEVFKTKVPQCSSDNSADKSYMNVDLLGQGVHQGQGNERPLTEPVNSDQHYQSMGYQINYDSHDDMAIQALLKSAECLYHDIVQKRKKTKRKQSLTLQDKKYLQKKQVSQNDNLMNHRSVLTNA